MKMLDLARDYTERYGLVCIPCVGKRPLGRWKDVKQTNLKNRDWNRATSLAILAGPSNVCVVDIDVPDGFSKNEFFNRLINSGGFDMPPMVETPSGGFHLYYKGEDCVPLRTNFRGLSIDTRVKSSYVIGPGSVYKTEKAAKVRFNGSRYKLVEGEFSDMFPLPEFWIKFFDESNYDFCPDTFTFTPTVKKQPCIVAPQPPKRGQCTAPVHNPLKDTAQLLSEVEILRVMRVISNYTDESREFWINGVWTVIRTAHANGYDAFELAQAWSKMLPGYDDKTDVKLRRMIEKEYKPAAAHYLGALANQYITKDEDLWNIEHLLRRKTYYHTDDVNMLKLARRKTGYIPYEQLYDFFSTAFAVVDRGGHENFMLRNRDGWEQFTGGSPFISKSLYGSSLTMRLDKTEAQLQDEIMAIEKTVKDPEERRTKIQAIIPYKSIKTSFKALGKETFALAVPRYRDYTHQHYYGLKNAPDLPATTLNTFQGYKYQALTPRALALAIQKRQSDWDMVIRHWRDCLCGGEVDSWRFLQSWLTRTLTRGYEKPPEMCVFISKQGYGKSMMWEKFMMNIIGKAKCNKETDLARFLGRFNGHRDQKILHIMNEISSTRSSHGAKIDPNKIKGLSDVNFIMELKNKERQSAQDFGVYVFLSNNEHSIVCENDDRRFLIVEAQWLAEWGKPDIKGDLYQAYFDQLYQLCIDSEMQQMFFSHLIHRPVDVTTIPMTSIKQRLKSDRYANCPLKFLCEVVNSTPADRNTLYPWYWAEGDDQTTHHRKPPKPQDAWFRVTRVEESYQTWTKHHSLRAAPSFMGYYDRFLKPNGVVKKRKADRSFDRDYLMSRTSNNYMCLCLQMSKPVILAAGKKIFGDPNWTM